MRGSMEILYPVMWQLLRLFLFEFVNWNSGNVFLCTFFFYSAWSVFFAIAPLPVLQSHCDKIAITHMFVYATGFFCNRSTSEVCNHTVKDVCNHLYFHQIATTSSKDQSSRILTVSWRGAFF
jgi:hypothetical protein